MSEVKIVINARFLTQKITGVQRYAIEISKHLKSIDPTIHFVSPKGIIHEELSKELQVEEFGVFKGHLWEQIDLPKYLRREGKPLLVNLLTTSPLFYRNKTLMIHDIAFVRHPEWFSKRFSIYYKFMLNFTINKNKKIFTISEFSRKEIREVFNVPDKKIEVIYCGLTKKFRQKVKNESNKYGDYILAVSSLDPRKNFRGIVDAFNTLFESNLQLVIVGGKHKSFTSVKIEGLENIVFVGRVSDDELTVLYQNAKAFIYPSLYEGFGMPPLEAMACGTPVIASNVASLPEVCDDAAFYVDPYDKTEIANAMKRMIGNKELREDLIKKGYENIKRFSWEKSGEQLYKIIKGLI